MTLHLILSFADSFFLPRRRAVPAGLPGLMVWLVTAAALPASAPWVQFTDLTASSLDAINTQYRSAPYSLRLESVSGHSEGGVIRYTGLWSKSSATADWNMDRGMTLTQLGFTRLLRTNQGLRPVWMEGFNHGGEARYNVIWEQSAQTRRLVSGLGLSDFLETVAQYEAEGFKLRDMSSFGTGFFPSYNGIFHPAAGFGSNRDFTYNQTFAAFNDELGARVSSGWKLERVTSAPLLNPLTLTYSNRYSAIWSAPPDPNHYVYVGLGKENFYAQVENATFMGYRPTQINTSTSGSQVFYNVVFYRNGGMMLRNIDEIHTRVGDFMNSNLNSVGVSIALSHHGRLVYARGFGLANRSTGAHLHPRHRVRIGSISKTVTGHAILDLVDRGLLSLDDRLFGTGSIFGNTIGWRASRPFSAQELDLKIRHLLTMTDGYLSDPDWSDYGNPKTVEQVIDRWVYEHNPYFWPGNVYEYRNGNYALLGMVIEKLSGKSYESYCQERVLGPAGISPSHMQGLSGALDERQSMEPVYYYENDPSVLGWKINNPGGGWVARPMDMLLFLRRINQKEHHRDLLPGSLLAQRFDNGNATRENSTPSNYGMSVFWSTFNNAGYPSQPWWGHNGAIVKGGSSYLVQYGDVGIMLHITSGPLGQGGLDTLRNAIMRACNVITSRNGWPADLDLSSSMNPAYDQWIGEHMPSSIIAQPQLWPHFVSPTSDPDEDGWPNAWEAYSGSNPMMADRSASGPFTTVRLEDGFMRSRTLIATGDRGVEAFVSQSTDLISWFTGPFDTVGAPSTLIFARPGFRWREARVALNPPHQFMRVGFRAY